MPFLSMLDMHRQHCQHLRPEPGNTRAVVSPAPDRREQDHLAQPDRSSAITASNAQLRFRLKSANGHLTLRGGDRTVWRNFDSIAAEGHLLLGQVLLRRFQTARRFNMETSRNGAAQKTPAEHHALSAASFPYLNFRSPATAQLSRSAGAARTWVSLKKQALPANRSGAGAAPTQNGPRHPR